MVEAAKRLVADGLMLEEDVARIERRARNWSAAARRASLARLSQQHVLASERERAVYDPEVRAFFDPETDAPRLASVAKAVAGRKVEQADAIAVHDQVDDLSAFGHLIRRHPQR